MARKRPKVTEEEAQTARKALLWMVPFFFRAYCFRIR